MAQTYEPETKVKGRHYIATQLPVSQLGRHYTIQIMVPTAVAPTAVILLVSQTYNKYIANDDSWVLLYLSPCILSYL